MLSNAVVAICKMGLIGAKIMNYIRVFKYIPRIYFEITLRIMLRTDSFGSSFTKCDLYTLRKKKKKFEYTRYFRSIVMIFSLLLSYQFCNNKLDKLLSKTILSILSKLHILSKTIIQFVKTFICFASFFFQLKDFLREFCVYECLFN